MARKEVKLGIGDIVTAVASESHGWSFELADAYNPFLCEAQPEVTLYAHYGYIPDWGLDEEVFNPGGAWSLHYGWGKWVVRLPSISSDFQPHRLAVFEPDFQSGEIYIRADVSDGGHCPYPLGYPLDQVLMVNLLARGRGVLFHACGVSDGGRGLLFAGTSGAGKSTLANLWKDREGVTVLSDDRVIVREQEGRFWAYGTPWHGDAGLASSERAPLDKIFFIGHAPQNRAVPLSPLDAALRLLVRSFPTFWNAAGMAFTLELLDEISQAVPCYELGFLPDESVLDFVRCVA